MKQCFYSADPQTTTHLLFLFLCISPKQQDLAEIFENLLIIRVEVTVIGMTSAPLVWYAPLTGEKDLIWFDMHPWHVKKMICTPTDKKDWYAPLSDDTMMRSEALLLWTSPAVAWSGAQWRECGMRMTTAVSEGLKIHSLHPYVGLHTFGKSWKEGTPKSQHRLVFVSVPKKRSYYVSSYYYSYHRGCFFSFITLLFPPSCSLSCPLSSVWLCLPQSFF